MRPRTLPNPSVWIGECKGSLVQVRDRGVVCGPQKKRKSLAFSCRNKTSGQERMSSLGLVYRAWFHYSWPQPPSHPRKRSHNPSLGPDSSYFLDGDIYSVWTPLKPTWTNLLLKFVVGKRKMNHDGASWITGIWEHVELFQTVQVVLFIGVDWREFDVVLLSPFLGQ